MPRRNKTSREPSHRCCLIVERHAWETGFAKEQIQIPLSIANQFFGSGEKVRNITVRLADAPGFQCNCRISKVHRNRTRRINNLPYLGLLGHCFVFFQESDQANVYDLWSEYDVAIVAARFHGWTQAQKSQYGRGRLAIIVCENVMRPIDSLA